MTPRDDDFALFGLPRRYTLDRSELDARRRALQGEVHPDRFASADAQSRRIAMQTAVRVNEAYQRLKDPLSRARYLCQLGGTPIDAEDNTAMPPAFLMQQMEWREQLDEAVSRADIEAIASRLAAERDAGHARLANALDEAQRFDVAVAEVRALMFVERFTADVDDRLHTLQQA